MKKWYLFKRTVLSVRNKDADESAFLTGTVTSGREIAGDEAFLTRKDRIDGYMTRSK